MIKKSETSLFINNSKLKKKGLVFATQRDGPHKHVRTTFKKSLVSWYVYERLFFFARKKKNFFFFTSLNCIFSYSNALYFLVRLLGLRLGGALRNLCCGTSSNPIIATRFRIFADMTQAIVRFCDLMLDALSIVDGDFRVLLGVGLAT